MRIIARNSSVNSVGAFPPNAGHRIVGDSISEAIVIADATLPGVKLTEEQRAAWQLLTNTNVAWQRGNQFAIRARGLIDAGQITLANRSYHRRSI